MSIKVSKIDEREFTKTAFDKKGELTSPPMSSYLKLKMYGTDMTAEFVNSIRRTILLFIPTYAFPREFIDISTNTTNLDNDKIRLRVSQLPIFDVHNSIDRIDNKYLYMDYTKYEKHPKENKKIEMFIKAKNTKNEIMNVTTDDIELYIDDKLVKYKKTDPLLVVQLSPKSELVCRATGVLGIGFRNDIWSVGQCHYTEHDDHYLMTVKSYGQISEREALKKACAFLKENCHSIEKQIKKLSFPEEKNKYIITLENEDFTCACIIGYYIQNNDAVKTCGVVRENYNIDSITFKIELTSSTVAKVFNKAITEVIELYKKFEDAIAKI